MYYTHKIRGALYTLIYKPTIWVDFAEYGSTDDIVMKQNSNKLYVPVFVRDKHFEKWLSDQVAFCWIILLSIAYPDGQGIL